MLRTTDYKLWINADGEAERLHHLPSDPTEKVNLLEGAEGKAKAALDQLLKVAEQFPEVDAIPRYTPLPAQPWDRKPASTR